MRSTEAGLVILSSKKYSSLRGRSGLRPDVEDSVRRRETHIRRAKAMIRIIRCAKAIVASLS